MPDLIHLNGPPAVGKSTLAAMLVGARPLALNLDIDELRVRLGGWRDRDESKQVARDLGFRLAEWHLASGHDVVLPQLVVLPEVVDDLEAIALRARARFVEVVLVAPVTTCLQRLARHATGAHPRDEFSDGELAGQIEQTRSTLLRFAETWPGSLLVDTDGDVDEVVRRAESALRR